MRKAWNYKYKGMRYRLVSNRTKGEHSDQEVFGELVSVNE